MIIEDQDLKVLAFFIKLVFNRFNNSYLNAEIYFIIKLIIIYLVKNLIIHLLKIKI